MSQYIPQTKGQWIVFGVFTVHNLLTEYWLGRTDKVKAGSQLELFINIAASIIGRLRKDKSCKSGQMDR